MGNFIPEGQSNAASVRFGGRNKPNFVPIEGSDPVEPRKTREEQADEAERANERRTANAKAVQWDQAAATMKSLEPVARAVGLLDSMALSTRELHLLAEEVSSNRSTVLGAFPPVGPVARETWKDFTGSSSDSFDAEAEARFEDEGAQPVSTEGK